MTHLPQPQTIKRLTCNGTEQVSNYRTLTSICFSLFLGVCVCVGGVQVRAERNSAGSTKTKLGLKKTSGHEAEARLEVERL